MLVIRWKENGSYVVEGQFERFSVGEKGFPNSFDSVQVAGANGTQLVVSVAARIVKAEVGHGKNQVEDIQAAVGFTPEGQSKKKK